MQCPSLHPESTRTTLPRRRQRRPQRDPVDLRLAQPVDQTRSMTRYPPTFLLVSGECACIANTAISRRDDARRWLPHGRSQYFAQKNMPDTKTKD